MKKQFILFIAAASMAWTACSKNDDAPRLQKLSKITEIKGTDTTTTTFKYNGSQKLSTVTADGQETNFTYNNNNLVTLESKTSNEDKTVLQVVYDGKPVSATYSVYEDGALSNKYKITYTVASNKVTEILMKDSTNTTTIEKYTITYQNNNVSKIENKEGENVVSSQVFVYGTKKSAVYNTRLAYLVDPFVAQFFSENEITKETNTIGNSSYETTNVYTYDTAGFPTAADVSEKTLPSGTPEVSKLKFDY